MMPLRELSHEYGDLNTIEINCSRLPLIGGRTSMLRLRIFAFCSSSFGSEASKASESKINLEIILIFHVELFADSLWQVFTKAREKLFPFEITA